MSDYAPYGWWQWLYDFQTLAAGLLALLTLLGSAGGWLIVRSLRHRAITNSVTMELINRYSQVEALLLKMKGVEPENIGPYVQRVVCKSIHESLIRQWQFVEATSLALAELPKSRFVPFRLAMTAFEAILIAVEDETRSIEALREADTDTLEAIGEGISYIRRNIAEARKTIPSKDHRAPHKMKATG